MSEGTSDNQNVVTLGGGTGTFVVLSALKELPHVSLTAIVGSADSGGSTGHLRDAYGFLPPGDARQALVALAADGTRMRELFAYRFERGNVAGHSLGNLLLTALTDIAGSDSAGIAEASRILQVHGTVLSATDHPTTLIATLADDAEVSGEHLIDEREIGRPRISKIGLSPALPFSDRAREAVSMADTIILGPGDLYTSTIAALLAQGTREAFAASKAQFVYIMNLFTKAGQTHGFNASDHVQQIEQYAGRALDHIIVHSGDTLLPESALAKYRGEGESPVMDDLGHDPRVLRTDVVSIDEVPALAGDPVPRSLIRHDPTKLRQALASLLTRC